MDRLWVPSICRPFHVGRVVLRRIAHLPFARETRRWSSCGRGTVRKVLTISAAASSEYIVQQGDTLHLIARKFNISTQDLKNVNKSVLYDASRARVQTGAKNPKVFVSDLIFPGDRLLIPPSQAKTSVGLDQTLSVAVPVSTPSSQLSEKQFGGIGGQWLAGFAGVMILSGILVQRLTRERIEVLPETTTPVLCVQQQSTSVGVPASSRKEKVSKGNFEASNRASASQTENTVSEALRPQGHNEGDRAFFTAESIVEEPSQNTSRAFPAVSEHSSPISSLSGQATVSSRKSAKEIESDQSGKESGETSTIIPNWISMLSTTGSKETKKAKLSKLEPEYTTRSVAAHSTIGTSRNVMDGCNAELVARLHEALDDVNVGSDVTEDQKGAIIEAVVDLESEGKKSTESQILMNTWGSWRLVYTTDRFVKNATRILESTSLMKLEEIYHDIDGATKTAFSKMSVLIPTISGDPQAISVRTSQISQVRFSHTNGVPEAFLPQFLSSLDVDTSDFPASLSILGQEINVSALQQLFTPVRNGVNAGLESAQSVVSIVERFLPQQLTEFVRSRADKWVRVTCVSGDVLVCRDESDEVYVLTKVSTRKEGENRTLDSQDEVAAANESDQAVAL